MYAQVASGKSTDICLPFVARLGISLYVCYLNEEVLCRHQLVNWKLRRMIAAQRKGVAERGEQKDEIGIGFTVL